MRRPASTRFRRLRLATILAFLCVAMVPLPGVSLAAPAPQRERAQQRVQDEILARFKVLPVSDGVVLVPLSPIEGVDNIELREGSIAINGNVVTGAELRQRLGRDASAIIGLSYFDVQAQQELAERSARTVPGPVSPPPAVPESAREPAVPRRPEAPAAADRTFRRHTDVRVRVGGDITVDEDERVDGDVVAIFGSVTVNGRVDDNVVAVGGDVRLGPRAEVGGDVTSVGGTLTRDAQSVVGGQINEVAFRTPHIRIRPVEHWPIAIAPWWDSGPLRTVRLFGTLLRMGLFALLATLVLLLLPGPVARIEQTVRHEPWKSALAGLFAQLFFVPLLVVTVVVLAISIIGIPLLVLVPFAVLAFLLALIMGLAGAASAFARGILDRSGKVATSSFVLLVVGLAAIWGVTIVGRIVTLAGGPLVWFGALILATGFLVEYAAWTMGLGGALLTRFGRRGRAWTGAVPPPVPPPPTPVDLDIPEIFEAEPRPGGEAPRP